MNFVSILEAGRSDFLEAVREVAPAKVTAKPARGWTVLECIEHVVTVEKRYLEWIAEGKEIPPQRDTEKEMRLFAIMRSRLTKVETPEPMRPCGKLTSLEAALAEFQATRDRSVSMVRDRGDSLSAIGATHPYFGAVNGTDLVQMIDGHARRHADQIRETWD
ncbi:MAG: DinB family protein [Bryobacteraceae bacterium]